MNPVVLQANFNLIENLWAQYARRQNRRTFVDTFGCTRLVAAELYTKYGNLDSLLAPIHFLWFLEWARNYQVHHHACVLWGVTWRTHHDVVIRVLRDLAENIDEIDWNDRLNQPMPNGVFLGVLTIVDGTECPTKRPKLALLRRVFYSGKKKAHTMKYQVIVRIWDGLIVWADGGYPGRVVDVNMFRGSNITNSFLPFELTMGDSGYQGEPRVKVPFKHQPHQPLLPIQVMFNNHFNSVRVMVERAIGRIKFFKALRIPWRHRLLLHPLMFRVCAHIANMSIRRYPLVTAPNPRLF